MVDKLLTIKEAAAQIRVHWQTIRNHVQTGRIPAVKIGRSIRIKEKDLWEFIDQQKIKPARTPPANKKLVVVADDFGRTAGINRGILRAWSLGLATEVSLIVHSLEVGQAVRMIKERKIRNVGLHLTLVEGFKLRQPPRSQDYTKLFRDQPQTEIEKLALKEIERFNKITGQKPSHLIPHKGIHGNLKLLRFIIDYAKTHQIPVRLPRTDLSPGFKENYAAEIMLKRSGVKTTDYLFAHVEGADLQRIKSQFLAELSQVKEGQSTEIMTHPGYFDRELIKLSSLTFERSRDLALLLDANFAQAITSLGFSLVSYSQI